ncbi:MAG: hypothetical protein ACR2PK_15160, partial [Acidimicrobiales bacterium]
MEGPTQTATWNGAERWRSRPVVAFCLRAAVFLGPILVAIAVSYSLSVKYPPERLGLPVLLWWILLAAIATAVMIVADRFARRFLPLAALMKLSLVFPDKAPARFKKALRSGTTNQLA